MDESMARLVRGNVPSDTETYVLQRMSELEKKMDVVNADYLQLSWRLAESYDENTKLTARIAELERKVNDVDAGYVLTEVIDENFVPPTNVLISTLSTQKHNIKTLSFSKTGPTDRIILEN